MKLKYKRQMLSGGCAGIIIWIVFTITDAIDEIIINTDSSIGIFMILAMPVILLSYYIKHYMKQKPEKKKLFVWFGCFYATFIPLWWVIYNMVCENVYIISQSKRTDWISLNGIEYNFYGYAVFVFFPALCLIFHSTYIVIKKIKIRRNKTLH